MKVRRIDFADGADGFDRPECITCEFSVAELAAIAVVFGKLNGNAHRRLKLPHDLYGDLARMFNTYWDRGVDDLLDLDAWTLNVLNSPEDPS